MRKRILIITTGGTILQKEADGIMHIALSAADIAGAVEDIADHEFLTLDSRTGAEMDFSILLNIRDVINNTDKVDGVVLITGTDSMEEVAFALDQMLLPTKPVVLTGAMKPSDILGYDGSANLNDAIKVAASDAAKNLGVLIVMNDSIHAARYVRKSDSALIGSFQSHPGPIGQIRCGLPIFYFVDLPKIDRFTEIVPERLTSARILIWTMVIHPYLPIEALDSLDGIIIAGMGTGSVSTKIISLLSPQWTTKIPIVISSRCSVGLSYDDYYYRGSRKKYEDHGFKIGGYENLNPFQARIKLALEIAS